MALTEVRLRSRKTPHHEGFAVCLQPEKRRNKKRKRGLESDVVEDEKEGESCAALFSAAHDQLKEEMKAAGMEGSLPMSFGGRLRPWISKQRKRSLQRTEQLHDKKDSDHGEMENHVPEHEQFQAVDKEKSVVDDEKVEQGIESEAPRILATVVHEVCVMDDSNGEVADGVVPQVENIQNVKPQEKSIFCNIEHKQSNKKAKKIKYPVPKDVVKFYVQRHILFEKFEQGIQLDHESWYSVTPQIIAEHIAKRLACNVVVDPFSGCGGNVIQLAMTCKQVIAIDIDPAKIRMAKRNATIYGVADKIEFIVGNAIHLLPRLKADVVFLSPPWGGVKYRRKHFKLKDMLVNGLSGLDLFAMARLVSKNIAYYLPRGSPTKDLEALTPGEPVECERIFLNNQLKVITAYYGDLAGSEAHVDDTALPMEEASDTLVMQE